MPNKDQICIIRAFKGLVSWAKTQLNAMVKVFFSNNDAALGLDYTLFAQDEGIQILHSAWYTDSQHGKPERAEGVILMCMRSMMIAAQLPEVLWSLATQAATYLINHTPSWITTADGTYVWTTPHEHMLGLKPNITNLQVFGCHAYVRDAKVPQGRKMAPRAWIDYLIGLIASNIWQIWHPRHQEVFNERDVVFNESLFYDPDLPQPQDIPVKLPLQTVEMIQLSSVIREADAEPDPEPTFDDLIPTAKPTDHSLGSQPLNIHAEFNVDSTDLKNHHDAHSMERSNLPPQPLMMSDHTPMPEPPQDASQAMKIEWIPGAFEDSLPASPEAAHMDSFFIPLPTDRISPTDNEDPDPAARQLSAELEECNPAPCSSSGPPSTAGGEEIESSQPNRRENTAQRSNEIDLCRS